MEQSAKIRISKMMPLLPEDLRRKYAALEAISLGRNGVKELHELTGMSKTTLYAGIKEVEKLPEDPKEKTRSASLGRIRKEGAGRKSVTEAQPGLLEALLSLLDGYTVGNPENPLTWTTKSLRNLSDALKQKGFFAGRTAIEKVLEDQGFSLQQNRKYVESGDMSPDRNEQFEFINDQSREFIDAGEPVISVDTKKKELVGNYKNAGSEYCRKGAPVKVKDHDFVDPELGRACPYGVYDIAANKGFVNITLGPDTAQFAVNSIRSWWQQMGKEAYPEATKLMITADGGGSNGRRNRLWKVSLQEFADETGLEIHVSHFPAGTSKWNKIEHRLFCFISKNWRGRPLETLETIVSLIGSTTTSGGLTVKCIVDENTYEKGIKVSDQTLSEVKLLRKDWHGEWNYIIRPNISN